MALGCVVIEDRRPRHGITLLEVLISCGLLVVGLSAMAALLPAAGSRLAQASLEDRTATLLSNALAEISNRGIARADMFPVGVSTVEGAVPAMAIGAVIGGLPTFGELPSGQQAAGFFVEPSSVGRARCGSPRTFLLEDGLIYGPPRFTPTPVNAFAEVDGAVGPRQFRQGVCWGATLAAQAFPPRSGDAAVLSVAIFKEADATGQQPSTSIVPIVLTRIGTVYEADTTMSGALLRGCSWVLAVPKASGGATRPPRWFKVVSAWAWRTPAGPKTRLVVGEQQPFAELTASTATNSTATILAFEGLLRVDEQTVTLH